MRPRFEISPGDILVLGYACCGTTRVVQSVKTITLCFVPTPPPISTANYDSTIFPLLKTSMRGPTFTPASTVLHSTCSVPHPTLCLKQEREPATPSACICFYMYPLSVEKAPNIFIKCRKYLTRYQQYQVHISILAFRQKYGAKLVLYRTNARVPCWWHVTYVMRTLTNHHARAMLYSISTVPHLTQRSKQEREPAIPLACTWYTYTLSVEKTPDIFIYCRKH